MTTPLHTQAQQLETALRDASRATNNPAYAALAVQVQAVSERLKEIEPEPVERQYRMLEEGEEIKKGDEFYSSFMGYWVNATLTGCPVRSGGNKLYRRPIIPAGEFQTLTEFHQREVQK
jgi:hypothetical protein